MKSIIILTLLGFISGLLTAKLTAGDIPTYEPGVLFGSFIGVYFIFKNKGDILSRLSNLVIWLFYSTLAYTLSFLSYLITYSYYTAGAVGATVLFFGFDKFLAPLKKWTFILFPILGVLIVLSIINKNQILDDDWSPLFIAWHTIMALAFSIVMKFQPANNKKKDKQ